ncbi:MAG: hypothetical protein E7544_05990 [Ruminococcaceae bacterium]|nr:hypothetical protein [Oscillospiraceae bacterium]
MKNNLFKKSMAVFLSVLMILSCWVWVAPTEAEAAATTANVTTSFTLSPNGTRGATDWTRLALTGESNAGGTSVVLFRFTNADLKTLAELDEINLQLYAYSCNNRLSHNNVGVTVNADIYYISQNASFVSGQGTNKNANVADTDNAVLGTDYTYENAQNQAKTYFGLSDANLVGSFEQPAINGQDNASLRTGDANCFYTVTDIVKEKAASDEDLSFIVMLRQGYSCSGTRGWSDIYIDSDTIALSGYNVLDELKSRIEAYEGYFSNGTFYTNLQNNYKAYNDAKRYYDAVKYGGVQFDAAIAQQYISAIDTAIANTGTNDTYVDYLNANITSRDGSTVSAAYRKNVIWYPWDFSWDITSNSARPTIQDTYFYFTMPNTIVGITNDSETTFPLHSFFWTTTGSRYVRYVIAGSGTISSGVVGSSDFATMAPWKISNWDNGHPTEGLDPGADGFGGWVFERNYLTDVTLDYFEDNSNNYGYSQDHVYQISSYAQINKSTVGVNATTTYKKVDQGFTFATANSSNRGTTSYGNHYASNYSNYGGALHVVYMDTYKNNYQNWKTLIPAISYQNYNGYVYSDATNVTKNLDYASEIPLNLNLTEANRVGDISSTVTTWAQNINKGANDLANAKAAGTTRVTTKYVDLINAIKAAESTFAGGGAQYTYASWNNFVAAYNAAKAHMASLNPNDSNVQYSSDATAIGNLATALNDARNALEERTYDVTYENMFSFSSWANSASSVLGTPDKGTMTYDVGAGTITVNNNDANTQPNPNDHYSSCGFGNGHYNMTLVPGETYTFEYTTSGGTGDQVHIFFYDDNGNAIANPANRGNAFAHAYGSGRGTSTFSFTAPENATKAAFRFGSTVLGDSITFSDIFMYSHTRGDYADIANWTERPNRTVFNYNQFLGTTLDVPERPGYTFDGWWVDSINPNGQKDEGEQVTDGNGTVVANLQNFGIAQDWVLYSEWTVNKYTVTWKNEDGTVLETDTNVEYGTTPTYDGETPTKPADAQYTYTFKGWSPEVTEVTGDVTYTAVYEKTQNSFTVTWKFADGTEKTESYAYGATPTAPANTTGYNDASGHHTYAWPTLSEVTGNVTYEETLSTAGHTPGAAATCQAPQTCTVCGIVLAEKLAHTEEIIPAVPATCTTPGKTEGKKCSVCGEILVAQQDTELAAHTEVDVPAVAATCTSTGLTAGKKCSVCGAVTVAQTETPMLAHVMGDWSETKAPTCITAGEKTRKCANCTHTETEAVAATGVHVYGEWSQFNNGSTHRRTCTADVNCTAFEEESHNFNGALRQMTGNNYHQYKCEKCEAYGVGTQINAGEACFEEGTTFTQIADNASQHTETCKCGNTKTDNHTWSGWVADPENKTDNQGKMSNTCLECEYKLTTGCTYSVTRKEPTCTEDGLATYTCKDCGNGYTVLLPQTGHDYGDCTYDADGNHKRVCANDASHIETEACTDTDTDNDCLCDKCSNLVAHKYGEATCEAPATCSVCGATTGEKLGHDWAETTYSFAADGKSCTATRECLRENCDVTETATATITSAVKTPATCTVNGWTTYTATFEETWATEQSKDVQDIAIDADNHDGDTYTQDEDIVAGTCVSKKTWNEVTYCSDCKAKLSSEAKTGEIDSTNHENTKNHEQTNPTCLNVGHTAGVFCSNCGKWISGHDEIPAIAHKNKEHHKKIDSTCMATGTIEYWSCPDCGKNFSDEECTTVVTDLTIEINPDAHSWGDWTQTIAPTCSAAGEDTRTCKHNAEHKETRSVDIVADAHKWETEYTTDIEPKCETPGSKSYHCEYCDTINEASKTEIPATDHNWNEGVVTTEPGCTTKGEKTFTCQNDNSHTKTEDIPALNHIDEDNNGYCDRENCKELICDHVGQDTVLKDDKAATCLEEGYTGDKHCKKCDVIVEYGEKIDALGHSWNATSYDFAADGSACTATRTCKNDANHVETATATIASAVKAPATCTVMGWTTYTATFTETWATEQSKDVQDIAIDADNHDGDTYTQDEDIVAGTCVSKKTWNEVTYCSDCKAKLSSEAKTGEIDSTNHENTKNHEQTNPTCLNVGHTAGVFCSNCGKWISGHDEIPAIAHKNKEHHKKIDSTCMATGTIEYWSCPDCGKNFSDEECTTVVTDLTIEINPDAHSWGDWTQTIAPTCSAAGEDTRTCKHNAEHKETRSVDIVADAHKWETEYTTDIEPKCETPGSKSYHCEYCDTINEASKTEIPATDHDYDKTKSESNLTRPEIVDGSWTQGYYTFTCGNDSNHKINEFVDRASYRDYEAAKNDLAALQQTDLTAEAKEAIQKILDENVIADNLIASEQNTVDSATANLKDAFEQYKGSLKTYTVTFVVDGVKTETTIISGNDATAPTDVKKAYDETYHYEFAQWDTDFTNVTSDLTVTAVFKSVDHTYTHTDKDDVYHTDACSCGYSKDVKHTETSEVTTKASCDADGVRTYTCSVCSGTRTEKIAKREHNIVDTTVATAPTCSATGIMNQKCDHGESDEYAACDYTTTRVMDKVANAHNWAEATYSFAEDGSTCTAERVCKNDANHVEKANATITSAVKTPATCLEMGTTTYTATFDVDWAETKTLDVKDIKALDHDWADTTYNFAADGKSCTAQRVCKRDASHVENANATITSAVKTPATCTVDGWTTYTATFTEAWAAVQTLDVQDIAALKHDWNAVSYDFAADGKSCTAERVCNRADCGAKETATATITSAEKTPATCTVMGWTTYTATFTETWAAVQYKDVQDISINANNHDGETYTKDEDIVAGTCISEKTWNEVTYCSDCDTKLSTVAKTGAIDSENHVTKTNHFKTDATCTDVGYTAGVFCEDCDKWISGHEEIPAPGHDYKPIVTSPTCEEKGYTTYTCSKCSDSYVADEVAALGHTPAAAVKENNKAPTCTEKGSYDSVVYCSVCTKELSREKKEVEAKGHDYTSTVTTAPTCSTEGVRTYICNNDASHTYTEAIAKLTHKDENPRDAICDLCGTTLTCEHPETELRNQKFDSCITEGYTGDTYCKICGKLLANGEVIPAGNHKFGEKPATVINATCITERTEVYKCENCSATKQVVREDDQKKYAPHTLVIITEIEPTCDKAGFNVHYCTYCSTNVEVETINPTGHIDENGDGNCDVFGCGGKLTPSGGNDTDRCTCLCHNEGWFWNLIYKIVRFFWKLFKISKTCDCGFVHY